MKFKFLWRPVKPKTDLKPVVNNGLQKNGINIPNQVINRSYWQQVSLAVFSQKRAQIQT